MFREKMGGIIKAGAPLIKVNSMEYDRVLQDVCRLIFSDFMSYKPRVFVYNATVGFQEVMPTLDYVGQAQVVERTANIDNAIRFVLSVMKEDMNGGLRFFIFKNFSLFLIDSFRKQFFYDFLYSVYELGPLAKVYVIDISPEAVPMEMSYYFVSLDYPLPSESEIEAIVSEMLKEVKKKASRQEILKAISLLKGLSKAEIENTLALSIVMTGGLDMGIIRSEKAEIVRKTGLLEWIEDVPSIDMIGGLENLKMWFHRIAYAMKNLERAQKYGLQLPKGCLLCGIPGTGKTLSAKAIASLFELPLFRLDLGKLFSSYVGETEKNVRNVLRIIDALSPCVVLIDEVEKGFAGYQSSGRTDSGVVARLMGSFLYYMQEKKTASFFVCTANDITALPPEFLRKGRFDEIWYVDIPTEFERKAIWKIHLAKVGKKLSDEEIEALARESANYTGAEIEGIINDVLYRTFYEEREPTYEDFVQGIRETTPLSVLEADRVKVLREWAKLRKVKVANINIIENKKVRHTSRRPLH